MDRRMEGGRVRPMESGELAAGGFGNLEVAMAMKLNEGCLR